MYSADSGSGLMREHRAAKCEAAMDIVRLPTASALVSKPSPVQHRRAPTSQVGNYSSVQYLRRFMVETHRHNRGLAKLPKGRLMFRVPASASSSPTCRSPPNGLSPFTITGVLRNNGSRKARTPSYGRGCRAASSATMPSGSSFKLWPTTSPTSCGRWPCRRRWNTGL